MSVLHRIIWDFYGIGQVIDEMDREDFANNGDANGNQLSDMKKPNNTSTKFSELNSDRELRTETKEVIIDEECAAKSTDLEIKTTEDKLESNKDIKMDTSEAIKFKSRNKRNLRRKVKEDSSDEEEMAVRCKVEDLKELQNLRKRPHGVSVLGLALGTKDSNEEASKEAFKIQSGGMINMHALKTGKMKQVDDAYDTGIGTQFSVETNKRDEDEEMMKYIEEQLSKRKGNKSDEDSQSGDEKMKYCSPEEAALQAVPAHLRQSSTQRSEEMLSNQMLSGIPEVDLGIEAKIKNIEATEEAKLNLLRENMKKNDGPSQFVPSNMAVNFIQHNRFNVDMNELPKKRAKVETTTEEKPGKSKKDEKATDDYHYERFKKQFRKH